MLWSSLALSWGDTWPGVGGAGARFFLLPRVRVPLSTELLFVLLGVGGLSEEVSEVEEVEVFLRWSETVDTLTSDSVLEQQPSSEEADLVPGKESEPDTVSGDTELFFPASLAGELLAEPPPPRCCLARSLAVLSTLFLLMVSTFPQRFFSPPGPATLSRIRLRWPTLSISRMETSSSSHTPMILSMSVIRLSRKLSRYCSSLILASQSPTFILTSVLLGS